VTAAQAPTSSPTTGELRTLLFGGGRPDPDNVEIVDQPMRRVHHPSDIVSMVAAALGIALILLLSYYAQNTTAAVGVDVRGFNVLLRQILFIPVNVLEGLVTIVLPVAVLIELLVQRLPRQVIEAIAAAVLGMFGGLFANYLIFELGSPEFRRTISVVPSDAAMTAVPAYIAAITAMLVVAGPGSRRQTVRWSWRLLTATIVVFLIGNLLSLPGALLGLCIGALFGHAVRYVSGVQSERAYGASLVTAVERAGFQPTALVRVRNQAMAIDPAQLTNLGPVAGAANGLAHLDQPALATARVSRASDSAALALARHGDMRVYAMLTEDGARYDVSVLDGDRQVPGVAARWWRALRLRGIEGRTGMTLKSVAERDALLTYSAAAAGVRTPQLLGVGMAEDSAVLVTEHARGATALRDLPDAALEGPAGDALMAEAWHQLRLAHAAGLTHHQLTPDVLLVSYADDGAPQVWITGWEMGEIASSVLSRRLDLVQMLAMFAVRVGPQRAVLAMVAALPEADIRAIGPLLQTIALPAQTRIAVRRDKPLMANLREAIVEQLPEIDVQPQRLARFGARTIITLSLTIVAVAVVVTTVNFDQVQAAIEQANPWWVAAAFGLAAITWVGAALSLAAFAPGRVSVWKATMAQMAGSFVALATPAGVGPAALNLRFLNRAGIATPAAVASVALMQASQFVVTVVVLLVLSLTTGSGGLVALPSRTLLLTALIVAAVVVAALLVPPIRNWAWEKIRPTLAQIWPRLSQMLAQPVRLALGLGGNLLMSLGYVLAFYAALLAFGQRLNLIDVAVIYLVGNTIGALVPTPGGLGGVEGALITGLSASGVPVGVAVSVTLLFRLVTYWFRVPIGWVAMRYLERKGDL